MLFVFEQGALMGQTDRRWARPIIWLSRMGIGHAIGGVKFLSAVYSLCCGGRFLFGLLCLLVMEEVV